MKNLKLLLVFTFLFSITTACEKEVSIVNEEPEGAITENMEENEDANNDDSNNNDDDNDEPNDDESSNDNENTPNTSLRTFIFGHSLIVHDPPAIATPSNETTVPHWMAAIAADAGLDYAVAGQYGFLPQHDNLPPISQWGFDLAQAAWESDQEAFSEADFNTVMLTAANFIQYQAPTENYYNENISPADATRTILNWVNEQEPNVNFYIYENWPDMAGFIEGEGFPPAAEEFNDYNLHTRNEFHQWWINYHDIVVANSPDLNVKMIPVGPIISTLLTETALSEIAITELYEDNAPHGRPTIYFLAGLITYMAMYETEVSTSYEIPNTVNPIVRENFEETVGLIWEHLQAFNFSDGTSRVFN